MPLHLDPSLALRPDLGVPAREAGPTVAEREQFAKALSRAEKPAPSRAEAPTAAGAGAPTLVRATRTRLSGEQAAEALRSAWTAVRGEPPRAETLSILVGQWAHETGRGASMLNYNFGGIKGTGPSGLSAAYTTREGFGESATRGVARFRAYGSAEEGARDYVSLLARRYPEAVSAAERGDAGGFVRGLKARGYFTDDEAAYIRSVQSLAALATSAGFGALGAAPGPASASAGSAPALAAATRPDFAERTPGATPWAALAAGGLLGALPELGVSPLGDLPVAPAAFADEVNRAALLMSALRIAEPPDRRG